jgi:hypothetical protein
VRDQAGAADYRHVDIGSGVDKDPRKYDIAVLCGRVQGSPATVLPGVGIGSGF